MKKKLPDNLGGEFYFSLIMLLFGLFFAYVAIENGSGRNLIGTLAVAGIFSYRMYDRVQKVRLSKRLREDPDLQRTYDRWHQD